MPSIDAPFSERIKALEKVVKRSQENWLKVRKTLPEPFKTLDCPLIMTEQYKISSIKQFQKLYERVIKLGGEGVMIKHPDSQYEDKRSNYLLKYKPNFDAEGIIMDYSPGKGKYKGMLGGFICKPLINKDTITLSMKMKIMNFVFLVWMMILEKIINNLIQSEQLCL